MRPLPSPQLQSGASARHCSTRQEWRQYDNLEVVHSARTSACSHIAARACKPCLASMPLTAPRAAAQVRGGRCRGGLAERPAVPGRRGACAAAARAPAAPGRVRAVPHRARHAVLLPQGARLPATPRAPRAPRQAPDSRVCTWVWFSAVMTAGLRARTQVGHREGANTDGDQEPACW